MENEKLLCVGKVSRPQGVKGELRLNVLMDKISDIVKLSVLYIGGKAYSVSHYTRLNGAYAVKLEGVSSVEEAASFKGLEVFASKETLESLKREGDFFVADLLGKTAVFENGKVVGTISDVQNYGASDIIFIDSAAASNLCFANIGGIILSVDEQRVVLDQAEFEKVCVSD